MLIQCKTTITFHTPVEGKDLQDSSIFLSTKHWVLAEVLIYDRESAQFVNNDNEIVAEWPCSAIAEISIPVLDSDSPVILAQKSKDYLAQVKAQRPNAWNKWTPEEDKQLLHRVEEGLSYTEISEIHQRTPVAIYERLRKLDIDPEEQPNLGTRPEKRHYEKATAWTGKLPANNEIVTVCLGCGFEIYSRPCMCWKRNDTSHFAVWRKHNHQYSIYGTRIYEKSTQ